MAEQRDVMTDLVAEGDELDKILADLPDRAWQTDTPAPGWTVTHQVAHLAATYRMAGLAATDPDRFIAMTRGLSADFGANVRAAMEPYLAEPPAALLASWQQQRSATEKALAAAAPETPLPWLVRPLPPSILAAAGMMELFGHGQDIADAVGVHPQRTDRLGHLVAFGARTWDFGYQSRGLPTPDVRLRFEITAPSGALWTFGPDVSAETITGPAEDFCLLVTRRRHRDDLALTARGEHAGQWLDIAQAYRGPAGAGRRPGQFVDAKR